LAGPKPRRSRAPEASAREPRRRIGFEARRELIIAAAREVFAELGYRGASMGEIARRAGIAKPTLYDHFESKKALHLWLLERTREDLLRIGGEQMQGPGPPEQRVERTFDAFFAHVQESPYAWRMLFRETTDDPDIAAEHRRIHAGASAAIARMLLHDAEVPFDAEGRDPELANAVGELMRGGLHSISLWWQEHPDVAREDLVSLCMDVYWQGIARLRSGRTWQRSRRGKKGIRRGA
jgi:AcrR family transcriptional regulator